jgi:hypothetical protein
LQLKVRLGKAQLGSAFIICAVFSGALEHGWWITVLAFGGCACVQQLAWVVCPFIRKQIAMPAVEYTSTSRYS